MSTKTNLLKRLSNYNNSGFRCKFVNGVHVLSHRVDIKTMSSICAAVTRSGIIINLMSGASEASLLMLSNDEDKTT